MDEKLLEISKQFWDAMEHADEAGMLKYADPHCNFVHIGVTAKLDKEIEFYTSGAFQPTDITFHNKNSGCFRFYRRGAHRLRLYPAFKRSGDHSPLYGNGSL